MGGGFGGMGVPGGPGPGGGRFHFIDEKDKPKISKKILGRIFKYYKPYWKLLILLIICIIATSLLGLVTPLFMKKIIDIALPNKNINLLIVLIIESFFATVISGLVLVGQNYLNSWMSKHIMFDIRNTMFDHLQYMSIKFFSNVQAGEITSRMNNDISGIENIFTGTVVQIIQNVLVFVTTAALMFYTNWKLALFSLLIIPLFVLPTRKVGKVRWKIASKTQAKLAELNTILQETLNIGGTFLVKTFTKEKYQQKHLLRQGVARPDRRRLRRVHGRGAAYHPRR